VNDKKIIEEIIKIFDTYPLLTSRKICQLVFLKNCLVNTSVEKYLSSRNDKYDNAINIINSGFITPSYFKP
jgi:hypothetical protein